MREVFRHRCLVLFEYSTPCACGNKLVTSCVFGYVVCTLGSQGMKDKYSALPHFIPGITASHWYNKFKEINEINEIITACIDGIHAMISSLNACIEGIRHCNDTVVKKFGDAVTELLTNVKSYNSKSTILTKDVFDLAKIEFTTRHGKFENVYASAVNKDDELNKLNIDFENIKIRFADIQKKCELDGVTVYSDYLMKDLTTLFTTGEKKASDLLLCSVRG